MDSAERAIGSPIGRRRDLHWSGLLLENRAYNAVSDLVSRRRWIAPALLVGFPIALLVFWNIVPLFQMLYISFLHQYPGTISEGPQFSVQHYLALLTDPAVYRPFIRTIIFAMSVVVGTFIVTLPIAYFLAKGVSSNWQIRLLLIVLIPVWVSDLIRIFSYIILFASNGAVNNLLLALGIIDRPIPFLYTWFSVGSGVLYVTAFFMLVPLYAAIEKVPNQILEAAADLGANSFQTFMRVTLPLIRDGIATGATLVYLTASGIYTVPVLLSGPSGSLFSQVIASNFSDSSLTWPQGAAFSVALFTTALTISAILNYLIRPRKKKKAASGSS